MLLPYQWLTVLEPAASSISLRGPEHFLTSRQEITMAENTQPSSTDQPENDAVPALQELEGADERPEVEAHMMSATGIPQCNYYNEF
jgi:hypothetical protein